MYTVDVITDDSNSLASTARGMQNKINNVPTAQGGIPNILCFAMVEFAATYAMVTICDLQTP